MFHICVAFLITLKSPQVSVSVSVYVLVVIERLFFELSTTDPESGEEISITFIAFIELDADQGHTHNPPPLLLKQRARVKITLGGSLRAATSVSLDLPSSFPFHETMLEDEVQKAGYSTSYLILQVWWK